MKQPMDIRGVLGRADQAYSGLNAMRDDAGAKLTIADRLRVARVLRDHLGPALEKSAKREAMKRAEDGHYFLDEVSFQRRRAHVRWQVKIEEVERLYSGDSRLWTRRVDTKAVGVHFPPSRCPELWQSVQVPENVEARFMRGERVDEERTQIMDAALKAAGLASVTTVEQFGVGRHRAFISGVRRSINGHVLLDFEGAEHSDGKSGVQVIPIGEGWSFAAQRCGAIRAACGIESTNAADVIREAASSGTVMTIEVNAERIADRDGALRMVYPITVIPPDHDVAGDDEDEDQ